MIEEEGVEAMSTGAGGGRHQQRQRQQIVKEVAAAETAGKGGVNMCYYICSSVCYSV